MPGSRARQVWLVWLAWLVALCVLALGAGAALRSGLLYDRAAHSRSVRAAAAPVAPPPPPELPADPPAAPPPTSAGLAAALDLSLRNPALGPRVALSVLDVPSAAPLLEVRPADPVLPASTAKLLTATAALTVLGPQARATTRVLSGGPGQVVLVGGGDPLLGGPAATDPVAAPARLADLAAATRQALGGAPVTEVLVDDSLYSGPAVGPGWRPEYVAAGDVAPVESLELDEGRLRPGRPARAGDPALAAGRAFAALLAAGHPVTVRRGRAPAAAHLLGQVSGPPVAALVEAMLGRSDNDLAESLARRTALAAGLPGSFAGGASAVTDAVRALLGDATGAARLVDGSGLSRLDQIPPGALTRLLQKVAASRTGRFSSLLSGLPVAGFSGTLQTRFRKGAAAAAAGTVRAKTGTLLGVNTLAGLVRTRDGRLLAFAVAAEAVPTGGTLPAEAALDRVAAALSACGCR